MSKSVGKDIHGELNYAPITLFAEKIKIGVIGAGRGALIKVKNFYNKNSNIEVLALDFLDEFYTFNKDRVKLIQGNYDREFILDKHLIIIAIDDKYVVNNIKGVFNATKAASECMICMGKGVILSTSSMVSKYGQPSGIAYPASKFAVNGFTVSLARELGPKGIRVNAVAPGITETDMMKAVPKEVIEPMIAQIPLRRLGQPEDIANAFVFLASEEASYITGVVLSVDGMART